MSLRTRDPTCVLRTRAGYLAIPMASQGVLTLISNFSLLIPELHLLLATQMLHSRFLSHSFTQSNAGDLWPGPFLSVSVIAPWLVPPWSRVWRGVPRLRSQKARLPPGLVWALTARPSPGRSDSQFIPAPSGVDFSAVAPGGSWHLLRPPPVPCVLVLLAAITRSQGQGRFCR